MNVQELIEKLKLFAPETKVVIPGYEGGLDDLCGVDFAKVSIYTNPSTYFGKYTEIIGGEEGEEVAELF